MFRASCLKQAAFSRQRKFALSGFVFVLFLSSQPSIFAQTNYYVANAGNDASNGTTAGTPFQSLAKVNTLTLQPGDSVLFRRGDTFRGTLTIRRSGSASRPIVFAAYGSGQKPVLAGSVPIVNWSSVGTNVWQASCSACGSQVTGVYRDNTALPLGRYPNIDAPNKGYLTIRAHTERYQIFSQERLPDGIDWKGGEVAMRPTQWIIDRAVIDAQYGDALNLFNYSTYYPADGWGFFIQSHPATLDQNGEWYYNPGDKTVRLYNSQTNPNTQTITATTQSRSVDAINVSNVALRNLHITQTLNESVFTSNVSSFTLAGNDITNSGEDGLNMRGSGTNILIENNRITDVNNNGVYLDAFQNLTFRGNSLRRVGMIPGRGKGGDGQYNGLQSAGNQNILIEDNVIDSVGYNGLSFWNNTTIQRNVISNYCMTKSDGGALYVWNYPKAPMTNIKIVSNILYNGIGAPEGSFRREYSGANGIFLDDCVENVELRNNTVFNNHQWGIYLHATSRIKAVGNTSFDNGSSQFVMYHNAGHCPFRDNVVTNNVLVGKLPSQLVAQYESNVDDLPQYGLIDSNYYARPFNDIATIRGVKNFGQGTNYSLSDWRSFSGVHDVHSKTSPVAYNEYNNEGAGGITRINSNFDTDNDGWGIVYSRYDNAEATYDNTNKLDGGSLRVGFSTPSGQPGSYAQTVKRFGTLTKGKTYVLRFDAVATVNATMLIHLRQYGPPFAEFDRRYTIAVGPNRASYELPFTPSDSDTDPIVMVQIDGEGPTFWLDNIRLQEGVSLRNNPDEFIRLLYNPTRRDSVITLTDSYRDVKNQVYSGSFVLKPFTSVILLKDTPTTQPADLSLSLQSDKRVLQINESTTLRLRVSNQGSTPAGLARWTCRLPANSQFTGLPGPAYTDNVLTGTVQQLAPFADTTFVLSVKATTAGVFRMTAQLTTATSADVDSRPNSGTADGEDDMSTTELRVVGSQGSVFQSPNPNQRPLPSAASNQPTPDPSRADLSIRMAISSRIPDVGEIITCTLYVSNAGGTAASAVQLQNQLPAGLDVTSSPDWTANGRLLSTTLASIPAGGTVSSSFQIRVTAAGAWVNKAQISGSSVADPDSTPGNGYTNGEDDQTQVDGRSQ